MLAGGQAQSSLRHVELGLESRLLRHAGRAQCGAGRHHRLPQRSVARDTVGELPEFFEHPQIQFGLCDVQCVGGHTVFGHGLAHLG